jgi:hypothetical protein
LSQEYLALIRPFFPSSSFSFLFISSSFDMNEQALVALDLIASSKEPETVDTACLGGFLSPSDEALARALRFAIVNPSAVDLGGDNVAAQGIRMDEAQSAFWNRLKETDDDMAKAFLEESKERSRTCLRGLYGATFRFRATRVKHAWLKGDFLARVERVVQGQDKELHPGLTALMCSFQPSKK